MTISSRNLKEAFRVRFSIS